MLKEGIKNHEGLLYKTVYIYAEKAATMATMITAAATGVTTRTAQKGIFYKKRNFLN